MRKGFNDLLRGVRFSPDPAGGGITRTEFNELKSMIKDIATAQASQGSQIENTVNRALQPHMDKLESFGGLIDDVEGERGQVREPSGINPEDYGLTDLELEELESLSDDELEDLADEAEEEEEQEALEAEGYDDDDDYEDEPADYDLRDDGYTEDNERGGAVSRLEENFERRLEDIEDATESRLNDLEDELEVEREEKQAIQEREILNRKENLLSKTLADIGAVSIPAGIKWYDDGVFYDDKADDFFMEDKEGNSITVEEGIKTSVPDWLKSPRVKAGAQGSSTTVARTGEVNVDDKRSSLESLESSVQSAKEAAASSEPKDILAFQKLSTEYQKAKIAYESEHTV